MKFDRAIVFITAANDALSRAGVDNRISPFLEIAGPDWQQFLSDAQRHFEMFGYPYNEKINWDGTTEVRLYGALVREKKP
jgi:hypothetical protein